MGNGFILLHFIGIFGNKFELVVHRFLRILGRATSPKRYTRMLQSKNGGSRTSSKSFARIRQAKQESYDAFESMVSHFEHVSNYMTDDKGFNSVFFIEHMFRNQPSG